jgi:16S rRNA (adenine1518-N6/adenine1519-N6)-dimethyltransferase
VVLHLLEVMPSLRHGLVMVQSEVADRLCAPPGSRVSGAPSAKAAWWAAVRRAGAVSRQVFWPVPNVDSLLVGFHRDPQPRGTDEERIRTFAIVDAAFNQRRKMLRQALSGIFGGSAEASAALEAAGVAPTARGEDLTVDDYHRIARAALQG